MEFWLESEDCDHPRSEREVWGMSATHIVYECSFCGTKIPERLFSFHEVRQRRKGLGAESGDEA